MSVATVTNIRYGSFYVRPLLSLRCKSRGIKLHNHHETSLKQTAEEKLTNYLLLDFVFLKSAFILRVF